MYDTVNLLQLSEFKRDLGNMDIIEACQKHLQHVRLAMSNHYFNNPKHHRAIAAQIIYSLAFDVDSIILSIWRHLNLHLEPNLSLIAIGGYGRRELHPYSDIDLLLYHHSGNINNDAHERIQQFVRILWDTDFKVSATMRNSKEIQKGQKSDIMLATSILEARLISGDRDSVRLLRQRIYEGGWSTKKFFVEKRKEQQQRHLKYNNISYQLEPDIKNSPGGLRDLQTTIWIAKHFLKGAYFEQLVEEQFISHAGMRKLTVSRNFLWSMRLGVHLLSGRAEERFLIDYQRELATRLGFKDSTKQRAVEALMQQCYQAILAISAVNDSVMQQLEEHIIGSKTTVKRKKLNDDFYALGDSIYCYDERCFENNPSNLLRCFLLIGKTPRLNKISAQCIHSIYENSILIDDAFRNSPENRDLFIQILASSKNVADILELMKRYGILGNYLPTFAKIIGQIQHDLFHVYTVDAHTLQLIRNLQNMLVQNQEKDLEIPAQITRQLPQFLLIIVAALFHDIAKGRGGDHSTLGAIDVAAFAQEHNFSSKEIELLRWLVQHHLYMSSIAQSKDLSDLRVIEEFAEFVENKTQLDYLYVLTVADIKATNPSLWNSWRAALLTRLYLDTQDRLVQKISPTVNAIVRDRKATALQTIQQKKRDQAVSLWQLLDRDFFVNKSSENIAWQTTQVLNYRSRQDTHTNILVMIRGTHQLMSQGATEIAIYSRAQPMNFADIVYTLDRVNLNIQEARIHNTSDGYVFDSFIVLGRDHRPVPKNLHTHVKQALESVFAIDDSRKRPRKSKRYIPPRLHKFWFEPKIEVTHKDGKYQISIICLDFPGLLTTVAESLRSMKLEVTSARITTVGEQARDTFKAQAVNNQIDCDEIARRLNESIYKVITLNQNTLTLI